MNKFSEIRIDGLRPRRVQTVRSCELPVRGLEAIPAGAVPLVNRGESDRLANAVFNSLRRDS